jgi:hypothetical protein
MEFTIRPIVLGTGKDTTDLYKTLNAEMPMVKMISILFSVAMATVMACMTCGVKLERGRPYFPEQGSAVEVFQVNPGWADAA